MKYGALILAAGASTRLGTPKQLLRFNQETLLERTIRVATEAGCSPVVVVLGAFEGKIRRECKLQGATIISHPDWSDGMGTSLARGIEAFEAVSGVTVMTCDMPTVNADHLRSLRAADELTASSYAGRRGVPAYFPSSFFPALQNLSGDAGARGLLRNAILVDLPGGELDIDTIDDLALARSLLADDTCETTHD